jgi:hypothetical protein
VSSSIVAKGAIAKKYICISKCKNSLPFYNDFFFQFGYHLAMQCLSFSIARRSSNDNVFKMSNIFFAISSYDIIGKMVSSN